jgi:hypothetical protein
MRVLLWRVGCKTVFEIWDGALRGDLCIGVDMLGSSLLMSVYL